MNDLSSIGWQPLVLGDGRRLEPQGLRQIAHMTVWMWVEHREGLGVGVTPDRRAFVIRHAQRDPTEYEIGQLLTAFAVDPAHARPGPEVDTPFVRVVVIGDD